MNTTLTAQSDDPSKATFFSADHVWLEEAFLRVKSAFDAGKMAHGMLLVAPAGAGKNLLAENLAKSILCSGSNNQLLKACGQCKNCSLVEAFSHPDLSVIDCLVDNTGKQKKSIGIDQVRQLTQKLVATSQLNGWRIAIIRSVEKMTRGAFNAILKTLEEPGDKTLLLMLANGSHQVPATIKSRCQILNLNLTENNTLNWLSGAANCELEEARQALHETHYAPFAAKTYIKNKEKEVCDQLIRDLDAILQAKLSPQAFLTRYSETADLLWIQMANYFKKTLVSILKSKQGFNRKNDLHFLVSKTSATLVSELYSQLLAYNRAQCSGSNLQVNLQLEAILIQWFEMGRKMSHY